MLSDAAKRFLHHLVAQEHKVPRISYDGLTEYARFFLGESYDEAVDELVEQGCLTMQNDQFTVTMLGYDTVCREKTIRGTQIRILMRINSLTDSKQARVSKDKLRGIKGTLAPCRQDHFDQAIDQLAENDIISKDPLGGITLTGKLIEED